MISRQSFVPSDVSQMAVVRCSHRGATTARSRHTGTRSAEASSALQNELIPSGRLNGDEERFEHLTHFGQLIVGVKATRVGEKPEKGPAKEFGLGTDHGFWSKESRPVRLQPQHRDA